DPHAFFSDGRVLLAWILIPTSTGGSGPGAFHTWNPPTLQAPARSSATPVPAPIRTPLNQVAQPELIPPTARDPGHVVVVADTQVDGPVPPPDAIAKEGEDGDPPAREPRRHGDGLDRHRIDDAVHLEIGIPPEPLGAPALER